MRHSPCQSLWCQSLFQYSKYIIYYFMSSGVKKCKKTAFFAKFDAILTKNRYYFQNQWKKTNLKSFTSSLEQIYGLCTVTPFYKWGGCLLEAVIWRQGRYLVSVSLTIVWRGWMECRLRKPRAKWGWHFPAGKVNYPLSWQCWWRNKILKIFTQLGYGIFKIIIIGIFQFSRHNWATIS